MTWVVRDTITQTFLDRVRMSPKKVGFQFKPTHSEFGTMGQWNSVTFSDFYERCRTLSYGWMKLGLQKGDRAGLLSHTRIEWTLCDLSFLGSRAVTVPLQPSQSLDDLGYIIEHSEIAVLVLENQRKLEKLIEIHETWPERLRALKTVVIIDPMTSQPPPLPNGIRLLTFSQLLSLGMDFQKTDPTRFEKNLRDAVPQDLFSIVYTSGTSGVPKGVKLTHDNMMSVLQDCVHALDQELSPENEVFLTFLPFSHIFGRVESYCIFVFGGLQCFAESTERLPINFKEIRPTLFFGVPRIFEKIYSIIQTEIGASHQWKSSFAQAVLHTGRRTQKIKNPLLRRFTHRILTGTLLRKTHLLFGGRLKFVICGGAPLSPEISQFFFDLGIPLLEGYGLTETCAPVTLATPRAFRPGSVGRPLSEVSVRIAEDGEILIRSRKVCQGYYKDEEATRNALSEGWLKTGDIGKLDAQGFLHITDRKKDIIITSNGKNIAPQKIENLAKTIPFLDQVLVFGDRREYISALVTLNPEEVIQYATQNHILFSGYPDLTKHPRILERTRALLDELNEKLAPYERIVKFVILPEGLKVQDQEVTSTFKPRRKWIERRYQTEIEALYAPTPAPSAE